MGRVPRVSADGLVAARFAIACARSHRRPAGTIWQAAASAAPLVSEKSDHAGRVNKDAPLGARHSPAHHSDGRAFDLPWDSAPVAPETWSARKPSAQLLGQPCNGSLGWRFDHVGIHVLDLAASERFYGMSLKPC